MDLPWLNKVISISISIRKEIGGGGEGSENVGREGGGDISAPALVKQV